MDNAGFEDLALTDGGFSATVPSWTRTGTGGTFNPTAAQFPAEAPEGANTAYVNNGSLRQTIAAETVAGDTVYVLEVEVGDRADAALPGWAAQLAVDGTVRASVDQGSVTPADGAFATAGASFTAGGADAGAAAPVPSGRFEVGTGCRVASTQAGPAAHRGTAG